MKKIEEKNDIWYAGNASFSSIVNVEEIIYNEDVAEYFTILSFNDRFMDREVRERFALSTLTPSELGKCMRGKGAFMYNEKGAFEIVQRQLALCQGVLRRLPELPLTIDGDLNMPDGNILPKRIMQLKKVKIEYSALGWKETEAGVVFCGSSKYMQGGIKDLNAEYAGDYDITPTGDFDKYLEMIKTEVLGNVPMEAVLAMAASATVLEYANLKWDDDISNIIIHFVKNSSNGKTTAMKLAVSFGGCPNKKKKQKSFFTSFNSTVNSRFKLVGHNNGFLVAFDELSMEEDRNLTQFLYSLADGTEKARMSNGKKLQEGNLFSTTILMTGEESILSKCDKKAGLRARVHEISGVTWTSSAESSKRIKAVCKKNYGFITPMIAEELLKDTDGFWEEKRDNWHDLIMEKIESENIMSNITERVADSVAILMVSAEIVDKILPFALSLDKILEFFFDNIIRDVVVDSNIGQRAYKCITEYFALHKEEFTYRGAQYFDSVSLSNIKGVYYNIKSRKLYEDLKKEKDYEEFRGVYFDRAICFTESMLAEILKKNGFPDVKVCMDEINAFGLLMTQDSERSTARLTAEYTINNEACTGYKVLIPEIKCDSYDN